MPSIMQRFRSAFAPTVYLNVDSDMAIQVQNMDAKKLYDTQANVQAVISFLASNIAGSPLKVYARESEVDRQRDRDSVAAKLLYKPNPDQTWYEFMYAADVEYRVYGVVAWWILPDAESESGYQLRILPRAWVIGREGSTSYAPDTLRICTKDGGTAFDVPRSEFVEFRRYSPGNPKGFLTPLSALRQTLNEQVSADKFRSNIWKSSGRLNAYIVRPKDVQPWSPEQRDKFVKAFRDGWSGDGAKAGSIPLLEDGMEIKPYTFNAKEAQYAESRQLAREDVAAAFRINPALIWHTGTQTYASARDNARALYSECLAPDFQMYQQRINSDLFPKIGAPSNLYCEFDVTEKIQGTFEERVSTIQSAVGGPWLLRDEARAMFNLPPIEGGSELIVPLNVTEGGLASPRDTAPDKSGIKSKAAPLKIKAKLEDEESEQVEKALAAFAKRQRASILPKIGAGKEWWDGERWDSELADDLEPLLNEIAETHGEAAAALIKYRFDIDRTKAYLRKVAETRAHMANGALMTSIEAKLEDGDPAEAFDHAEDAGAKSMGAAIAVSVAGWAVCEAVEQARYDGHETRRVTKTWVHNPSKSPRSEHEAMNGETVGIEDTFSNGARFPGDSALDAAETCYCQCEIEITIS